MNNQAPIRSVFEAIAPQDAAHVVGGCARYYYYSYLPPHSHSFYPYQPPARIDIRPTVPPSFETAANSFDEALFI